MKTSLMSLLDDNLIKNIAYKQWTSVDRSTLDTVSQPADEIAESLCSNFDTLLTHSFIAKQQSQFYSETKSSPPPVFFFVVSANFLRIMHLFYKIKFKDSTGITLKLQ